MLRPKQRELVVVETLEAVIASAAHPNLVLADLSSGMSQLDSATPLPHLVGPGDAREDDHERAARDAEPACAELANMAKQERRTHPFPGR